MTQNETGIQKREGKRQQAITLVESNIEKLAAMCSAEMNPDRLKRCFGLALMRNPDIADCEPSSIIEAVATAARLGLDPSGVNNSAHIIPFNTNIGTRQEPRWVKKATLIPGYGGLIDLASRAGDIHHFDTEPVFEGDTFSWRRGTSPGIEHVPAADRDALSKPHHVYAIAWFRDDGFKFEVMSAAEVDKIRAQSKSKDSPAWNHSYPEMARKTVLRRLMKTLRLNPDAAEALDLYDRSEGYDPESAAEAPERPAFDPSIAAQVRAKRLEAGADAEGSEAPETPAEGEQDEMPPQIDPDTGEVVPREDELVNGKPEAGWKRRPAGRK